MKQQRKAAAPKVAKGDPYKPSLSLLVKLGSIAVHADELASPDGHHFDAVALRQLIKDAEVRNWITSMGAFLPVKRKSPNA